MNKYNGILIAILTLTLTACGQASETEDSYSYSYEIPSYEIPTPFEYNVPGSSGWRAEDVRIQCDSGDCPEGVGLVLFVSENYLSQTTEMRRCTATLIDPEHFITNAHCSPASVLSRNYLILPKGDGVIVRKLLKLEYKAGSEVLALDRDLAIWSLESPVTELKSRRLSRTIPADMGTLVSYVINSADENAGIKFSLDKRECHTKKRVPILNGGTEDLAIGVSLYGCEVQKGNSGAPAFVPGDMESIQVVLNTIWNFDVDSRKSFARVLRQFYFELPDNSEEFFAMAQRVQCLDLPGQSAPESQCEKREVFPVQEAIQQITDEWYENLPRTKMSWGARIVPALHTSGLYNDERTAALAAVPTAVCMSSGWGFRGQEPPQTRYYRPGLDKNGKMSVRFLEAKPFEVEIGEGQSGYSVIPAAYSLDSSYIPSDDESAELLGRVLAPRFDVPICKGDEIHADRQQPLNPGS